MTSNSCLKKLGKVNYYENGSQIVNILKGAENQTISAEVEKELKRLFKETMAETQKLIDEDHPIVKGRVNGMSYCFLANKFCGILGSPKTQTCFPLLKSIENLLYHDQVWQIICERKGWTFESSL